MTKEKNKLYVYEPIIKATASIIWLHGLGGHANNFVGIINQLNLPKNHSIRFIFPNASIKKITINDSKYMRAWFDIYDFNFTKEDEKGIKDSTNILYHIINEQIKIGILGTRIFLAGFSQGGAMALYAGLRFTNKLAGIIALSSYLPILNTFKAQEYLHNQSTEIFMAHGIYDSIVPYKIGENSYHYLKQFGYSIDWNSYPIGHTLSLNELYNIGQFIKKILINNSSY